MNPVNHKVETNKELYESLKVDPNKETIFSREMKIGNTIVKVQLIAPKEITSGKVDKFFNENIDSIANAAVISSVRKNGQRKNYDCILYLGKDGSIEYTRQKNGKNKTKKYDRDAVALKVEKRMRHMNPLNAKYENS